jgi:hypothetical protein
MSFKWKDRDGAVNQAAYQLIKAQENLQGHVTEMTQEDIEYYRGIFNNPDWTPKVAPVDEKTYVEYASLVLGSEGRFQNYFCTDPENMKVRQWVQFLNDVKREVANRGSRKRDLAFLQEMTEKNGVKGGNGDV